MTWETVIGLEVHVQLRTATKMFCGCSTTFGADPNTHVCPVCLGLPGSLPVPNQAAIEHTMRAALALMCRIPEHSKFDRKNYFYPDMPKNYQISQYDQPLGVEGVMRLAPTADLPEGRRVGITRVHLEEDAGKLVHVSEGGRIGESEETLVDLNRAGVPLMEIVTEPDLRSPDEASEFLIELRTLMRYLGVSDCNMEEGSLRCDANVSVRVAGNSTLGAKTELKNLNSFKFVREGLEYEAKRHTDLLASGHIPVRGTRAWDSRSGRTLPMRSKEQVHDYRYFPDPDLSLLTFDKLALDRVRASLPELPAVRRERFIREFALPASHISVLTSERSLADYFETFREKLDTYRNPHTKTKQEFAMAAANWVIGPLLAELKALGIGVEQCPVSPEQLADLVSRVGGPINHAQAKEVFTILMRSGGGVDDIIQAKGFVQISDVQALSAVMDQVLVECAKSVEDYKKGKAQALGFLVGQIMKKTQGKANPNVVNAILVKKLGQLNAPQVQEGHAR